MYPSGRRPSFRSTLHGDLRSPSRSTHRLRVALYITINKHKVWRTSTAFFHQASPSSTYKHKVRSTSTLLDALSLSFGKLHLWRGGGFPKEAPEVPEGSNLFPSFGFLRRPSESFTSGGVRLPSESSLLSESASPAEDGRLSEGSASLEVTLTSEGYAWMVIFDHHPRGPRNA